LLNNHHQQLKVPNDLSVAESVKFPKLGHSNYNEIAAVMEFKYLSLLSLKPLT